MNRKIMKDIIGVVVYCALLLVYFPIYVMGFFTIQKNLLILKLRRFFHFKVTTSKLGLVSRRSRVTDVLQVSTDEEIDFQQHRSMAYVHRMAFWTPQQLVKTLLRIVKTPLHPRTQTIELISDDQLAFVILSTVFAHSVVWDGEREMYRLKMEGFEDLFLFQGFFWDARHVLVSRDGSKIIIQMDGGEEFASDTTGVDRDDFNLAKLHVQVCLSYFAPGLSHNHVHFVLPSAVCLLSKKILRRNGILYNLLAPHFRFTERINYQALRVGKATNNKRSILDRLFFLWQPFPVTKEQFLEGVARKCKKHYFDKGQELCQEGKELCENYGGMEPIKRRHTLFPPDYVTDKQLAEIPYLSFLRQYYLVVRKFVENMVPYIDKNEWARLSEAVASHVPKFDETDMVDAIATFIHQVGVVHFCDHNSYTRYFAYDYGTMAIRTPFETFKNDEHWDDIAEQVNISKEDIRKNPLKLVRQRDVMRTRCFLDLFVDFIRDARCNLQLIDTKYSFNDVDAKKVATEFMSQLKELDENLKEQKDPFEDTRRDKEKRPIGMQIVPVEDIVRSVCF